MAYCRFSSDNWRSDVYAYEDVSGGWTTHVASRKRLFPPTPDVVPPHAWWSTRERSRFHAWRWRAVCYVSWLAYRLQMIVLDIIPMREIGLPFDGETFNDPTPGACADRLEWLRGLGYYVPQFAVAALREEAAELAAAETATERAE